MARAKSRYSLFRFSRQNMSVRATTASYVSCMVFGMEVARGDFTAGTSDRDGRNLRMPPFQIARQWSECQEPRLKGTRRPRVLRFPPAKLSRMIRKSSIDTWVNCGLPAHSPIAQTLGAVVSCHSRPRRRPVLLAMQGGPGPAACAAWTRSNCNPTVAKTPFAPSHRPTGGEAAVPTSSTLSDAAAGRCSTGCNQYQTPPSIVVARRPHETPPPRPAPVRRRRQSVP